MLRTDEMTKALKVTILSVFAGLLGLTVSHAQNSPKSDADGASPRASSATLSQAQQLRSPMPTKRFFLSEKGRALLEVGGSPLSSSLNRKLGEPSPAALEQARIRWRQMAAKPRSVEAAKSTPCGGNSGARFNLEPRVDAVPQQSAVADFILNGAGEGADLVVQTANDLRGESLSSTANWDGSMTGYYVHRSTTPDCSVQFEGGLPNFSSAGNGLEIGLGDASVVADPTRGALFMADVRFAEGNGGIGLFRASASSLLNPTTCPNGTHTEAQANSCWTQTPPVLIDPTSDYGAVFNLAVDERKTGTGAGDVYLVASAYVNGPGADTVFIVACTNNLSCSSMTTIGHPGSFPYVQVRSDGIITISYLGAAELTSSPEPILFLACKPEGAPKPPVCGTTTSVTTITNPIPTPLNNFFVPPLKGINIYAIGTYPKHANRQESNGSFTTFLVYDDCKNPFQLPPPPQKLPTQCLNAEVNLTFSTDNGSAWSTPASIDTASGHHFYPAITADQSTGAVSLVYYSTEGRTSHHDVRVLLNQISPGSTALGPTQLLTTAFAPMDADPDFQEQTVDDLRIGAIARGTGVTGQSHLYTSFDLTIVDGNYEGMPVPEKNNHISMTSY